MHRNVKNTKCKIKNGMAAPRKRVRFERMIKTGFKNLKNKICKIKKPESQCSGFLLRCCHLEYGVPTGIRTPVTAVKGRCPRPLDDRDSTEDKF